MIEVPYICIVRGEGKDEIERQVVRWRGLSANGLVVGQVLDISAMKAGEASQAILQAVQVQRLERVAVESIAGLAGGLMESVALASAVLASGARLFVVSYAVSGARLVEIDRALMQTIAGYADEFKTVSGDDVLFLAGYAKQPVSLENLLYHLSALEESLKSLAADVPPERIATEIRRIALLVRVMQKQVHQSISVN